MDLNAYQVGYFIQQVGMSAASFGVTSDDVTAVGKALAMLFDYKCAPATTVIPSQGAQLQSICTDDSCPTAPNATCDAYGTAMMPAVANSTLVGNSTSTSSSSKTSSTASSTSTTSATASTAAGSTYGFSILAAAGGLAALLL